MWWQRQIREENPTRPSKLKSCFNDSPKVSKEPTIVTENRMYFNICAPPPKNYYLHNGPTEIFVAPLLPNTLVGERRKVLCPFIFILYFSRICTAVFPFLMKGSKVKLVLWSSCLDGLYMHIHIPKYMEFYDFLDFPLVV